MPNEPGKKKGHLPGIPEKMAGKDGLGRLVSFLFNLRYQSVQTICSVIISVTPKPFSSPVY